MGLRLAPKARGYTSLGRRPKKTGMRQGDTSPLGCYEQRTTDHEQPFNHILLLIRFLAEFNCPREILGTLVLPGFPDWAYRMLLIPKKSSENFLSDWHFG
jgi:hypothetical protein